MLLKLEIQHGAGDLLGMNFFSDIWRKLLSETCFFTAPFLIRNLTALDIRAMQFFR